MPEMFAKGTMKDGTLVLCPPIANTVSLVMQTDELRAAGLEHLSVHPYFLHRTVALDVSGCHLQPIHVTYFLSPCHHFSSFTH